MKDIFLIEKSIIPEDGILIDYLKNQPLNQTSFPNKCPFPVNIPAQVKIKNIYNASDRYNTAIFLGELEGIRNTSTGIKGTDCLRKSNELHNTWNQKW